MYAVDVETGKQKWKFKTLASRQGTSTSTIANGLVYFGGFDGILYAVDSQTGTMKWTLCSSMSVGSRAGGCTAIHPASKPFLIHADIYTSSPAV